MTRKTLTSLFVMLLAVLTLQAHGKLHDSLDGSIGNEEQTRLSFVLNQKQISALQICHGNMDSSECVTSLSTLPEEQQRAIHLAEATFITLPGPLTKLPYFYQVQLLSFLWVVITN